MKFTILTFECLDGSRYELRFDNGKPAEKLFAALRRRANKSPRGEARAAHGALLLRKVRPCHAAA